VGKKLTVYLIEGTDNGPRTIEIGNWSGKAIHSPRATLLKLMDRSEFQKPGVYVLKSDPNDSIYSERIYIGEAENIGNRLRQHLRDSEKDFKECIFFVSKDELLTKSHIKYIEAKLILSAREAKNAEIDNGTTPTESTLSEADISDMEYFIEQIKLVLPTAGYYFLLSNTSHEKPSTAPTHTKGYIDTPIIFSIKSTQFKANMIETNEGFVVLKGSEANPKTSPSISEGWINLREKLKRNNVLVKKGTKLIFLEDTIFSSTSAASSVILGRQSPGTIKWYDSTNGKTFKDYEIEKAGLDILN
jgi:hypothetical protein